MSCLLPVDVADAAVALVDLQLQPDAWLQRIKSTHSLLEGVSQVGVAVKHNCFLLYHNHWFLSEAGEPPELLPGLSFIHLWGMSSLHDRNSLVRA